MRRIRIKLTIFMCGLVISGLTAFPIQTQLALGQKLFSYYGYNNTFTQWIDRVAQGVFETNLCYPFMSYGTDWLAFAHLIIAVAFIGPWRDPVKNIWVIEFGIIACIFIFPLAMVSGHLRGIPFYWQLIDCSFGVIGGLILWSCHRQTQQLKVLINRHA